MTNLTDTQRKKHPPNKTNWGHEILNAFRIIGKVLFKCFSYLLNILLTILLIGLITGIIVGSALAIYIKNYIDPEVDTSLFISGQNATTKIYYMDYTDRQNRIGVPVEIEDQRLYGTENSVWASYAEMPELLVEAFVAIEDQRFWDHNGIDYKRIASAIFGFLVEGDKSHGASTITQQLIKNITGDRDVRVQRKIQEIFRALNLEKKKSKEEILELYLNIVPLSQGCYGVQSAAYKYFGKTVSQLNLIECAAIAAITNSPTYYDPILNPDNNAYRRDVILEEMLEQGKITQKQFNDCYMKELELHLSDDSEDEEISSVNSWYTDAVIEDVIDALMTQKGYTEQAASVYVYTGGLQIYTVMDPEVQATLEEIYENEEYFPKASTGIQPDSAIVITDPYTNDILGLVGGRGIKTLNRGYNLATMAVRPPGSSLKPLSVYAPALDAGIINYASVFDDVPVNFGEDYEKLLGTEEEIEPSPWPHNLPDVYNGLTNVNSAVERSVNTVAVRILQKLTIDKSFDFVKNKLHMDSFIERRELESGQVHTDKVIAALALGQMTYGATVREVTAAYSIFQNNGVYNESRTFIKVLDSSGNLILDNTGTPEIVISDQTATIMTKMLANVVNNGTGRSLTIRQTIDTAGKTGTSSMDYDRWFVGYTPYYVGGVWFGYKLPQALTEFSANPATKIWDTVMLKLHQKYIDAAEAGEEKLKKFETAPGVIEVTYCKDSGKLLTETCALDPRGSRAEKGYFTRDNMPTEYCDTHVKVLYDTKMEGVYVDGCTCDPDDLIEVALIRVENRSFPMEIKVTDAQYVYRDLTVGVKPGGWWGVPFFQKMLAEGEYVGKTLLTDDRVYNCACYLHYNVEETKPVEDPTPTDPPDVEIPDEDEIYGEEDVSPPDEPPTEDTEEDDGKNKIEANNPWNS